MKFNRVNIAVIIVLMAFISFQIVSCGSEGSMTAEGEGEPTESGGLTISKIEVRANETSIPADGFSKTTITATVKTSDNQAVSGADVTFTTSRGTITSPHETDENGQATAELTSERYNDIDVTVTANCQGVEEATTVAFTGIDLSLEAAPDNLIAGTSSTITATLKDAAGNPIPDATIKFSTNQGDFNCSENWASVTEINNSENWASVITDTSGQAKVDLTYSNSGTVEVTATGRGVNTPDPTEVEFTLILFTLESYPTTIRVNEKSTITATLSGSNVSGKEVNFSTTLGTLVPYSAKTDTNGIASTTLTAGNQSGKATIDANVSIDSTELSATTKVDVVVRDATKIILTANPNVISTKTGEAIITATAYDANDQPAANQNIYFRIAEGPGGGEYLSTSMKTTDDTGVATVKLYAGSLPSTLEGVVVEANTEVDFTGNSGSTFLTIAGPVANIGVGMNLETVTPEGGHLKVDVSALATDVNGNPVADGTTVSFSVEAIAFDEDRDYDREINCWDAITGVPFDCDTRNTIEYPDNGLGTTWYTDDVNQDGKMYNIPYVDEEEITVGKMAKTEDDNGNGILDPGEDKNGNGVIDPVNSCVIDSSVGTENGVAAATLTYLQPHAANIRIRITAEAGGVSNFYEPVLLCTEKMVDNGTCGLGY